MVKNIDFIPFYAPSPHSILDFSLKIHANLHGSSTFKFLEGPLGCVNPIFRGPAHHMCWSLVVAGGPWKRCRAAQGGGQNATRCEVWGVSMARFNVG